MGEERRQLGHLLLECFRSRPNVICRIDAATGESETNGSVLSRSIQMANSLRAFGLSPGDVMTLGGRLHLDLHIPYYAAMFNGMTLVGVDPLFKFEEIKSIMKLTSPKISFCEAEDFETYTSAARELGLSTKVVTFGDGEHSMKAFLQAYPSTIKEEDFKLPTFDLDNTYMWLISTSGTSGTVKLAAFKHESWEEKAHAYISLIKGKDLPEENVPALNLSPVQWVSGMFNPLGMPLLRQTIVQTSAPITTEHVIDIINKYKPTQTLMGPTMVLNILNHKKNCDLTCFRSIMVIGAKVPDGLFKELKSRMRPDSVAVEMYGQTETLGPSLFPHAKTVAGSCGSPLAIYQIQLIDQDTGAVITEPNVRGELCVKGKIFSEYYNSPEENEKAFTKDGWYRTGDIFYRDEDNNYFYVERIKMLIKYQSYHIVPGELESVIRRHPGVADVVVTSVPHRVDGEHAVAVVVRREGATVTADEIKQLVAKNLSEKKQLRGGVLFLKEFPLTSTGKVFLREVRNIAQRELVA